MPQTIALRTAWPAAVPREAEVGQVPFFPQDDYQCGPAALATVLVHSGVDITPAPLVSQVYVPQRQGSLQVEMLAAPRRYGRISYVLAPRYGDLLREVAAGNPVLVMQDIGLLATQWHYAVVNGFHYESGTIYLRSGLRARQEMPFTAFERSWMAGGYWAMVVVPPDRIPASAAEAPWLDAVLAFAAVADAASAARAYAAALARWPGSLAAAIGLAHQHHRLAAWDQAIAVLRGALQQHPRSVIAMNNLAQTLSDAGRQAEALAEIDRALALGDSPFAVQVRATRDQILQRLAQRP